VSTAYDDLVNHLANERQGEVDAARIEMTLWTLIKDAQRAEARTRRHPVGLELVVTIDGELIWSQAFAPQLVDKLLDSAATAQQKVLLSEGWQPARPKAE